MLCRQFLLLLRLLLLPTAVIVAQLAAVLELHVRVRVDLAQFEAQVRAESNNALSPSLWSWRL